MKKKLFGIVALLLLFFGCQTKKNEEKAAAVDTKDFHSWASTPPLGWNSWDSYGPTVVEAEVKANADYMAANLKQHGWEYIVVDIRWYVDNDKAGGYNQTNPVIILDSFGRLLPSEVRFPSSSGGKGFKPLADYIHSKGLKFGIHVMRGIPVKAVNKNTPVKGSNVRAKDIYSPEGQCRWLRDMYTVVADKPGAQEYYNSLFELYAAWGVDYVKIDDLTAPYHKEEIELIRKAIDNSGRQIVLSSSPGETPIEYVEHIKQHANLFRIVEDFWDNWAQVKEHFRITDKWAPHIGIGHWPDGDMLPLGKIGIRAEVGEPRFSKLTQDEQRTVLSLFSIFKSPLMFGGDLPSNDSFTLSLLTNNEVLEVNQHSANNKQLFRKDNLIAWTADDTKTGDKYLALFNAIDQDHVSESKAIFKSDMITKETKGHAVDIDVDITGAKKLYLVASQGDQEYLQHSADWIEPVLTGPKGKLPLTSLKWKKITATGPQPTLNKSILGNPLTVDSIVYKNGIATYANSIIKYEIPEGYTRFVAKAGLDKDAFKPGVFDICVKFLVFTQEPTVEAPTDAATISVTFEQLGVKGKYQVRDVWSKKDIGVFENEFSQVIRRHASGLYRLSKVK